MAYESKYALAGPSRVPSMDYREGMIPPGQASSPAPGPGSGMMDMAGNAGMASGVPPLQAAGMALKAGSFVADLYGRHKESERQDENDDRQWNAYLQMLEREDEDRRMERMSQNLHSSFPFAQYAQGEEDRRLGQYGDYFNSIGY